jgi:hypothetical protein
MDAKQHYYHYAVGEINRLSALLGPEESQTDATLRLLIANLVRSIN